MWLTNRVLLRHILRLLIVSFLGPPLVNIICICYMVECDSCDSQWSKTPPIVPVTLLQQALCFETILKDQYNSYKIYLISCFINIMYLWVISSSSHYLQIIVHYIHTRTQMGQRPHVNQCLNSIAIWRNSSSSTFTQDSPEQVWLIKTTYFTNCCSDLNS